MMSELGNGLDKCRQIGDTVNYQSAAATECGGRIESVNDGLYSLNE